MLGNVKRFNKLKGFGFITTDDGQDAFFHYSEIVMDGYKTVDEGARVEFDLIEGERGLQAHNIRKVESDIAQEVVVNEEVENANENG